MKKYLLILVFWGLGFAVNAQNYFNKIYRYSSPDSSNRLENFTPILEIQGSGFLVAGSTNNHVTKSSRLMISRLDYQGNTLSTQLYGDSGYFYYSRTMEFTYDTNVMLYAQKTKYTNVNDSTFMNLYKLDLTGNLIWSKEYTSGLIKTQGLKAIETTDHGFAILGWTTDSNSIPSKMYLIKTDSLGNKEWDMQYGDSASYFYNGLSLIQESDNGYVLIGFTGTNGTYYRMITMIRTDSIGNKLWQKDYGSPNSYAHGEWITKLKDGNYLISGQNGIPFGDTNGLLIKTDTLGNVIWQKNYGYSIASIIRGVVENADSTLSFNLSISYSPPLVEKACLYKVNSYGDSLWSMCYVYDSTVLNNVCYSYYMTSTSDGGYIICGQQLQAFPATQDAWLIKVDSVGCSYAGCLPVGILEIKENNSIGIYPNPASQEITLSFSHNVFSAALIHVFDLMGKQVYMQPAFIQKQISIPVFQLPAGIYVMEVSYEGKKERLKFVKE